MASSGSVIQGFFPSGLGHLQRPASPAAAPANRPVPDWVAQRVQPSRASQARPVQRITAPPPPVRPSPAGTSVALPPHLAKFGPGRGTPLAPAVRQMMESVFRTNFSAVTIHSGPHVSALGALAFTRGSEIHFAPGQYDPASPRGRHLLAHELAHVVQQRSGRVVNPFGSGVAVVQNFALEAEAERMARCATSVQTRAIQRMQAPKYTVATFLAAPNRYVRAPADEDQTRIVREVEFLLNASFQHNELDWGLAESRLTVAAMILALSGGQETPQVKVMQYLLGIRNNVPSKVFGGLGSLEISDTGEFSGRPGFVKGVFEESGGPGRHLRHESAHHNIQEVLNGITGTFGVDVLLELAEDAEPFVSPEVDSQVTQWILAKGGGGLSKTDFRLLWLACVLNNVKENLWLGSGKENVSINSLAGPLKKWVTKLDMGTMTIGALDAKLAKSGVSSAKGKKIVALARAIIATATAKPIPLIAQVNEIVNEIFQHCIKPLEVDVKPGTVENPGAEQLFRIANGVGDLGQALAALRQFLGVRD